MIVCLLSTVTYKITLSLGSVISPVCSYNGVLYLHIDDDDDMVGDELAFDDQV